MDSGKTDSFFPSIRFDIDITVFAQGKLILTNLVTLGEVRVEVVFPCPAAVRGDFTVSCQANANSKLNDLFVQHGQNAGKRHANWTGVFVGILSKPSGAAAKYLGIG